MSVVQDLFRMTVSDMNNQILDRQHEIRVSMAALLSRKHVFLLGPPGVAKSLLVTTLLNNLDEDLKSFVWLLGPTTDIQEIVGNISLKDYEELDVFRYNTKNKLPEAHVAFLDEIWKSQSALLNMLLTMLNERRFDNGTEAVNIPLLSCFGASNELPADDLKALYDRFGPRLVVNPVGNRDSFKSLLSFTPSTPKRKIYRKELIAAMAEVKSVEMTDEFLESMANLWERMKIHCPDVYVSDRRYRESIPYLQAQAYLAGQTALDEDSIWHLRDYLWNDPKDYLAIATVISQCCSETLSIYQIAYNECVAILSKISAKNRGEVPASEVITMKRAIDSHTDTINTIIAQHPNKAPMLSEGIAMLKQAKIKLARLM